MAGDLIINNFDADLMGVSMGKGFLDAIGVSLQYKDDIENESAIEHGKRLVLSEYKASRDVTLTFLIRGLGRASYKANDATFLNMLYGRKLTLKIKGDDNYYRLIYTGKGASYAHSSNSCTRTLKFTEVNPDDRGASPKNSLFTI